MNQYKQVHLTLAHLTLRGRVLLMKRIHDGLCVEEAARAAGVSVRTTDKGLKRFREDGDHV